MKFMYNHMKNRFGGDLGHLGSQEPSRAQLPNGGLKFRACPEIAKNHDIQENATYENDQKYRGIPEIRKYLKNNKSENFEGTQEFQKIMTFTKNGTYENFWCTEDFGATWKL